MVITIPLVALEVIEINSLLPRTVLSSFAKSWVLSLFKSLVLSAVAIEVDSVLSIGVQYE